MPLPQTFAEWQDLEGRLGRHVETLAGSPRVPGTPAHTRAAAYIREHLERTGLAVAVDAFAVNGGSNLRASLVTDPSAPRIVVGAHYDSVPSSPGADDNASGVAALLEIAAVLPHLGVPATRIELVAYDLEEYGMGGSWHHAAEIRKAGQGLRGMISLEMIGYVDHRPGSQKLPPILAGRYPDVGNFIGVCANEASRALMDVVGQSLKNVPGLPVECLAAPGKGELIPDIRRSDHVSFWEQGLPALMITDTSSFRNPHYHLASDRPETLDYAFMAKVCVGTALAIAELATRGSVSAPS